MERHHLLLRVPDGGDYDTLNGPFLDTVCNPQPSVCLSDASTGRWFRGMGWIRWLHVVEGGIGRLVHFLCDWGNESSANPFDKNPQIDTH